MIHTKPTGSVLEPIAPVRLTGAELTRAIDKAATLEDGSKLEWLSESEYPVISVEFDEAVGWKTPEGAVKAFGASLEDGLFADDEFDLGSSTAKIHSTAETAKMLTQWTIETMGDPADEAFAKVAKVLTANLTDIRYIKIGPKDEDGKLSQDQGLYGVFIVGKTQDGNLAGISYGTVET